MTSTEQRLTTCVKWTQTTTSLFPLYRHHVTSAEFREAPKIRAILGRLNRWAAAIGWRGKTISFIRSSATVKQTLASPLHEWFTLGSSVVEKGLFRGWYRHRVRDGGLSIRGSPATIASSKKTISTTSWRKTESSCDWLLRHQADTFFGDERWITYRDWRGSEHDEIPKRIILKLIQWLQ